MWEIVLSIDSRNKHDHEGRNASWTNSQRLSCNLRDTNPGARGKLPNWRHQRNSLSLSLSLYLSLCSSRSLALSLSLSLSHSLTLSLSHSLSLSFALFRSLILKVSHSRSLHPQKQAATVKRSNLPHAISTRGVLRPQIWYFHVTPKTTFRQGGFHSLVLWSAVNRCGEL